MNDTVHSELLRDFGRSVSVTFRRRRWLLVGLVLLCAVPGSLFMWMPVSLRLIYGYVLTGFTALAFTFALLPFANMVRVLPAVLLDRSESHEEYQPPELPAIVRGMGLKNEARVLLVTNPRVTGPFTNGLTRTIRLPKSWLAKFPHSEILSTIAHELGHVRGRRRFYLDMLATFGLVFVATVPLAFMTVPVIAQIFEVGLLLLLITTVSWRNEYRADLESARALGPEGIISVLEQLQAESDTDEGSETHPPLKARIDRLMKLLGPP